MHALERRRAEGASPGVWPRRAAVPEHPFLALQRMAGNAAVSRLVEDLAVQRQEDPEDEEQEEAIDTAEDVLEVASGPIGWALWAAEDTAMELTDEEEYGKNNAGQGRPSNAPAEGPAPEGPEPEGPEPEWPEPEWPEPEWPAPEGPEPEGPAAPPGGGPVAVPRGPAVPGAGPAGPGGIPGMEPVTPGSGPTAARPMLRVGSVGDAVREAQELLVRHGATLDPDGKFGPLTRTAVVNFQRSAGLSPDGIVGPRTWRALESA